MLAAQKDGRRKGIHSSPEESWHCYGWTNERFASELLAHASVSLYYLLGSYYYCLLGRTKQQMKLDNTTQSCKAQASYSRNVNNV